MKIGINARFLTLPHTGIGQYTINLLRGLAEVDEEHHYFLFTPELVPLDLPSRFEQVRVQEPAFRSPSLRKSHWEHALVPREMQQRGVDLAHFPYPANPWKRLPFPVVVTVHDVIPWALPEYSSRLRSKLYHFYARHALARADHLIAVSDFTKTGLIKLVPKSLAAHVSVIPNSTPPETRFHAPDIDLRRPYFLYVGGYDFRKNVATLLQAYQKVIAPFYAVDLVLVGAKDHGLEPQLTQQHALKITDKVYRKNQGRVVFTEPLSRDQLHFLYQKALGFAHVSHYEGFNIPLLEALHFGLPAVASDIPAHREVARDAALFVPPDDPDAIGQAMEKLIQDKGLTLTLSSRALERASFFTPKKHAEKTLDVYNLFA